MNHGLVFSHTSGRSTEKCLAISSAATHGLPAGIIIDSGAAVTIFRDAASFTSWDQDIDPQDITICLAEGSCRQDHIKGRGSVSFEVTDTHGSKQMVELDRVLHMSSLGHAGIVSVDRSTLLVSSWGRGLSLAVFSASIFLVVCMVARSSL